jgi:hypothetical protein
MSSNRRRRQQPRPPTPPSLRRGREFDLDAAQRVSNFLAVIGVEGRPTPLVEPIAACADHADFDRELCAAGIKRFVRQRMESDWPSEVTDGQALPGHLLVTEKTPGVRTRVPLVVVMNHEMN